MPRASHSSGRCASFDALAVLTMTRLNRLSALGGAILALGVVAGAAPAALADHNVYPPGWNKPAPNAGAVMYDFRPGCWGDSNLYWPEQKSCREGVPSRPVANAPVVYGMMPGGHHYHKVQ